jgi:hypothetical protein
VFSPQFRSWVSLTRASRSECHRGRAGHRPSKSRQFHTRFLIVSSNDSAFPPCSPSVLDRNDTDSLHCRAEQLQAALNAGALSYCVDISHASSRLTICRAQAWISCSSPLAPPRPQPRISQPTSALRTRSRLFAGGCPQGNHIRHQDMTLRSVWKRIETHLEHERKSPRRRPTDPSRAQNESARTSNSPKRSPSCSFVTNFLSFVGDGRCGANQRCD